LEGPLRVRGRVESLPGQLPANPDPADLPAAEAAVHGPGVAPGGVEGLGGREAPVHEDAPAEAERPPVAEALVGHDPGPLRHLIPDVARPRPAGDLWRS